VAYDLGEGDAEQYARLRAGDAGEKAFQTHAGINYDRNCTNFEKREGSGDQWQALPNHDQGTITRYHTARAEVRGPGFDFGIEGSEGEREIIDVAAGGPAARDFESGVIRLARRHQGQMLRDVGGSGHALKRMSEIANSPPVILSGAKNPVKVH
jgi:hypothetical protein